MSRTLKAGDALLVVDVQQDFCPGGALPVKEGDEVVPALNEWIMDAERADVPVFASRDWHPEDHVSFRKRGGPWPRHCVRGTPGAEFHPDLLLSDDAVVISKAQGRDRDAYSAFDGTRLGARLRDAGVERVFVGGLAEDVCVRASVLDALKEGFAVHVIADATRPVDPAHGARVMRELQEAGAVIEIEEGPKE